jgi:hypothetical protein
MIWYLDAPVSSVPERTLSCTASGSLSSTRTLLLSHVSGLSEEEWGEPHGLVKVIVADDDGTADITGHRATVCTCHFVTLASASQRRAPYW